jgi:leucyl aminopeptidase (aminopeptidase T)
MGGGSGGGGTTVTYQQPKDPYGDALKQYQLEQLKSADAKAAAAEAAKAKKEAEKIAAAEAAFDPFKATVQKQLSSGLLSYTEAQAQLKDYAAKYDLAPKTGALQELTDYYLIGNSTWSTERPD